MYLKNERVNKMLFYFISGLNCYFNELDWRLAQMVSYLAIGHYKYLLQIFDFNKAHTVCRSYHHIQVNIAAQLFPFSSALIESAVDTSLVIMVSTASSYFRSRIFVVFDMNNKVFVCKRNDIAQRTEKYPSLFSQHQLKKFCSVRFFSSDQKRSWQEKVFCALD